MHILITRPQPMADKLQQQLEKYNWRATACPLLTIIPPADPEGLRQAVAQISPTDWCFFVSPSAIKSVLPLMRELNKPLDSNYFTCMGKTSENMLHEFGVNKIVKASQPFATSEELLAELSPEQFFEQTVWYFAGQTGRNLIPDTLRSWGAKVMVTESYRTECPLNAQQIKDKLPKDLDLILITSEQCLTNLLKLATANQIVMTHIPLVVVSRRLEQLAQQQGFKCILAESSRAEDLVKSAENGL